MSIIRDEANETTYCSTDYWFRWALGFWHLALETITFGESKLSVHIDDLLPSELGHRVGRPTPRAETRLPLELNPAGALLSTWSDLLFSQEDLGPPIPPLPVEEHVVNPRRRLIASRHKGSDAFYGVSDVKNDHVLKMLQRMHDFLSWFPENDRIIEHCVNWADAVIAPQPNDPDQSKTYLNGGHLEKAITFRSGRPRSMTSWYLFDYIRVKGSDIGKPSGRGCRIKEYGLLAKALLKLESTIGLRRPAWGRLAPPPRDWRAHAVTQLELSVYSWVALNINWMAWEDRPNAESFLMADKIRMIERRPHPAVGWLHHLEPQGPLEPGERESGITPPEDKLDPRTHDTDSLYWARFMFDCWTAYGEPRRRRDGRRWADGLIPTPGEVQEVAEELEDQGAPGIPDLEARRKKVASYLERTPEYGEDYTRFGLMALATTIDWLRGGWMNFRHRGEDRSHFVRKIYTDGDPATSRIYGDGTWNTLFVLVGAFAITGDEYYLGYLRGAWNTLRLTSTEPGHPGRNRLFHPLNAGRSDPQVGRRLVQDNFIRVMLAAYEATKDRGEPELSFLDNAIDHARSCIGTPDEDYGPERYRLHFDEWSGEPTVTRFSLPGEGHLKDSPVLKAEKGALLTGNVFFNLALAEGNAPGGRPIRRIEIEKVGALSHLGIQLQLLDSRDSTSSGAAPSVALPMKRAVLFVEDGTYRLNAYRRSATNRPEQVWSSQGRPPYRADRHETKWSIGD